MARSLLAVSPWVVLALTAGYFVPAKLGLMLAVVHPSATAIWPPTGIALAAFLVLGYRVWPGIFLGAFLANITTAGSAATSLGIAAGNTLEGVIGAYLVRRFAHGTAAFDHPYDVFKFAGLAGMVSTAVSATFGVTSLSLGGYAAWADYRSIWLTWWLGDAVGALIVAPLLLLWVLNPRIEWNRARALEAFVHLISLLVVAEVVFGGWLPVESLQSKFLCIPIVVWTAFRLDRREAVTATALLSAMAIWGTLRHYGFSETKNATLLMITYMGVVALTVLTIAAAVLERRRSEAAVREREARLRATFNQAIVGIAECDATGRFVLVNKQYCDIAGRSEDALLRLRMPDITHPDDRPADVALFERMVAGGPAFVNEKRHVRPDGSTVWVNNSVSAVTDTDGSRRYVVLALDITDRKRGEEAQSRRESLLREQGQVLVDLARIVTGPDLDLRGALGAITEDVAQTLGVEYATVWCYNDDRSKLICLDLYQRSSGSHSEGLERRTDLYPAHFRALSQGRVIAAPDAHTDPRTAELSGYFKPLGVTSLLGAPIRLGGTTVGVVFQEHVGPPRHWSVEEENFAGAIGRTVGLALEAHERKLVQAERDRLLAGERMARAEAEVARRRLAFLAEASNVLSSSLDYQTTLHKVARLAVPQFADLCLIDLAAPDGSIRRVAATVANPAKERLARELLSLPLDPAGSHPVAKALRAGRPQIASDITDSDLKAIAQAPRHLEIAAEIGYRSYMVVPLVARGRTLGALSLVSGESGRRYNAGDLALAEDLAHRAALAVDNARLFGESEAQRGEAQALAEIGRVLTQSKDPREAGQRIVERVRELVGAKAVTLYRTELGSDALSLVAVSSAAALVEAQEIVPIATVGLAVRQRRPLVTSNVMTEPNVVLTREAHERLRRAAYRAVLAMPLLFGDRVVGALALGDHAGRAFDDAQIRLTRVFADQAALALENARLFDEAEWRRREAEIVAEMTRSAGAALDTDAILRQAVEGAKELCRCDMASVAMREPRTERLVFSYGVGTPWGYMRVEPGKGQVLVTGMLSHKGYLPDPRSHVTAVARGELLVSELAVPIRIEDRTEGLLYVASRSPRPFTHQEEAILLRLADHAAIAIRNVQLYRTAGWLAAIVESSDDAIVSKTLDGIIVSWNKGAERIYGYFADEVQGRSISILAPRDRPDEIPEILQRIQEGERIDHYETVRLRKDGRQIEVSLTVSPVKDATGKLVGASVIARDITDRRVPGAA